MANEMMANEVSTLHQKLIDIQQRLKVPKDTYNDFAQFNYRNLEDIEDKVKPFLKEHLLTLTFEDDIVEVGGRVYVKATAVLSDGTDEIKRHAFAREAVTPKAKTDDAQLTGACSSYARKYAASGLFLIDNTKDADSQDNSDKNRPAVDTTKTGGEQEELARAKSKIFKELEKQNYITDGAKQAFIRSAISKPTIDTIDDCNIVMDALENNKEQMGV